MGIFDAIKSWFTPPSVKEVEASANSGISPPNDFQVSQPLKDVHQISLTDATTIALEISSSFEGHDGFGNIAGNFDEQGLTCGALGFAWKQGRQQSLVKQCMEKHPHLLESLMPKCGQVYSLLAHQPIKDSLTAISSWSTARGLHVAEPYASELRAFWSCPEMIQIQTNEALHMAKTAYRDASLWSQGSRKLVAPLFHEFVFFFDVLVQNGSIGISYQNVSDFIGGNSGKVLDQVLNWCAANYNTDTKQNAIHWKNNLLAVTDDQKKLFILGYLRALKSDIHFRGSVMNRRGTLALLHGYVNQQWRDFSTQYPFLLSDIVV